MHGGGVFLSAANETEIEYKTQTLAEWCGAHNQPYTSIEPGGGMVQRFGVGQKFLDVTSPPVFLGRLSDSLILPVSTFSCTPDHTLIHAGLTHRDYALASDIGPFLIEDLAENKFLLRIPNNMPTVDQECIFLGGRANFGHFLFESLMRWAIGSQIPNSDSLPVAIYDGLPARFYEFLDLAGIPKTRRILLDPAVPTRFRRLWRASSPLYRSADKDPLWWPEGVRFINREVRSRALSNDSPPNTTPRPILYVARGAENWRRILNEADVIECVRRYGGTPVSFDGLPAKEQVQMVGNARAMILPVGAAAAVSLFAPMDCAVLELVPPTIGALFGPVAYATCLGQPYVRLLCPSATPADVAAAGLKIHSIERIDTDYWVDCNKLEAVLKTVPPG